MTHVARIIFIVVEPHESPFNLKIRKTIYYYKLRLIFCTFIIIVIITTVNCSIEPTNVMLCAHLVLDNKALTSVLTLLSVLVLSVNKSIFSSPWMGYAANRFLT